MDQDDALQINSSTYEWSVRIFTILKKILRVNLKLHHKGQVDAGDIFLFNHFARFETFIPQYLIYQETGAQCRSVASKDFFVEGSAFSNYLLSVGSHNISKRPNRESSSSAVLEQRPWSSRGVCSSTA